MKQARRLRWFVLLTVLVCAVLGGIYGRQVEATTGSDDSDVKSSLNSLTRVYDLVEQNYADPVDSDRAIFGSGNSPVSVGVIPGALRTLDPHSTFFDPRAFSRLREDQEGKYFGVGMQIAARPGKMGKILVVVLAPIPGSPAFRAGLRPGDIIIKVDGKSTEGLTGDAVATVASMLKGPKGTLVHVTVSREGYDQPLDFEITRDEISQLSVGDAFMIAPGIAYIKITKFTENTNDELTDALKKLNEKSFQGLILDLRSNPGGLLQAAVEVADHFLQKSQLIVYHNGRHAQEKPYYAQKGNGGNEYPIVVLIDRMTASASEIVTGALQDHDRALVIGEPSFGKGLVQTVFPLSEHTGLALTTARYYTPSGRLIQRDYNNVSWFDYLFRPEDSPAPHTEAHLTDGGREVYGGGGITPDILLSKPKPTPTQLLLLREAPYSNDAFSVFSRYYLGIHKTIPKDFQVTDSVMQEFREFLTKEGIQVSDQDVKDNLDFIQTRIRAELVASIYGGDEADKISWEKDPLVQKALESLPQAKELLAKAKRYMASKAQR
jgi:carboxyl-terminal processing protease